MRHLESPFCHSKEVSTCWNFFHLCYVHLNYSHFHLGTILVIGNVLIIRVTSVDVGDVAPPTVKLSDAKCHASLLSRFLLENSLYFGVDEIMSFQKLVGNLEIKTVVKLGRQHQRSLDSYFESS